MRALISRLLGADRPRVIAIFGATREEVRRSVGHVQAGAADLPLWAWCGEAAEPVEGCTRFVSGAAASHARQDLREVWPALAVVAWTRSGGLAQFRLLPFLVPPFRVLVQNEAGDFFPGRPGPVAVHARRRLRDFTIGAGRRISDWVCAVPLLFLQLYVLVRDFLLNSWGIVRSLAIRSYERVINTWGLIRSLAIRSYERLINTWGLVRGWGIRRREEWDAARHFLYESGLAALAVLLKDTGPWVRATVRRHTGRRHLAVKMDPSGDSFVEVRLYDRGWPRREVLRALRTSGADYVVFRQARENGDARPLIEAARANHAFAVAKQVAFSHWRQRMVTRHPFRKLQEGEIAQVFAPWSSLLVVRRDAFSRLGCPHALTSGAALMILYWRAAAAGLASFSAGCGNEIADENAMVLEDAEFAVRLALSPRLHSLGPLHPSRLEGNVASMPALARPSSGRPRVLVVSPYLPWPLSHGGAVRIYNLCRSLAQEVDFILACFRENGETVHYQELHQVFREVYIVDANEKRPDPEVPAQVAEYRNSAMAELIRNFCLSRRVDLVQLEYTQMAEYRLQTGAVPVLLVEHDITFTLHRQFADTRGDDKTRQEYERWLTFEREALQCSNAVWTMSGQDRDIAIRHGAPAASVAVIPNGVDLQRFQPEFHAGNGRHVLFIGSFRHLPNLLAFEALRETIMPEVWREFPDARLHVIGGPNHQRAAAVADKTHLLEPDPRICVEGFVADVRPAYREADVVVIPLPVSAGTNIKLMEAMACGRAVVSTPVGCQGVGVTGGRDLLVAGLGSEFAAAVNALLRDAGLRDRIAAEARITADRHFGWDAIARDAADSYARLLETPVSVAAD